MYYDTEYWRDHYPTKEEAIHIIKCCDAGECYNCPYNQVGCSHFDIAAVKRQALKDFLEENTFLKEENQNLKEAYKELQEEFTKYINGGTDEI